MGSQNNQNFGSMPTGLLKQMIIYKASDAGIKTIMQEESYTSQADITTMDYIPVYGVDAENTDGLHCFAIPAILEQRKRNKMAYHTILLRKFFFVYSVFMIIKKEPFRILLHVLIKHVPSKLHIQNRNHADTCRSTDSSASGQALDRLVAVSSIHCCTSTSALSTSSSSRGLTSHEWDISS